MPLRSIAQLLRGRRSLAVDVMWSGLTDTVTIVTSVASFLILGRELGPALYGAYVGIIGVVMPIAALASGGTSLLVLALVIREGQPPAEVARRLYTLSAMLTLGAAVVAPAIALALVDGISASSVILLAVGVLVGDGVTTLTANVVRSVRGLPAAARILLLVPLSRFAVTLAVFLFSEVTIDRMAIWWAVASIGLAVLVVARQNRVLGLGIRWTRPGRRDAQESLGLSLPMLSGTLQAHGDKAVLNAYGFAEDAGLYGAAFRIITFADLPLKALNTAAFTSFLSHDASMTRLHVRRGWRFSLVALAAMAPTAIFIFVAAGRLEWLLGSEFAEASTIIRWLCPYLFIRAFAEAPRNGLIGLGRTKERAIWLMATSIGSVILYVTLIPMWSWKGAVVGTIAAELVGTITGWYLLFRYQRIEDEGPGPAGSNAGDRSPPGMLATPRHRN